MLCSCILAHFTSTEVSKVASFTDNSLYISQRNFKNRMRKVCVYPVLQMSFWGDGAEWGMLFPCPLLFAWKPFLFPFFFFFNKTGLTGQQGIDFCIWLISKKESIGSFIIKDQIHKVIFYWTHKRIWKCVLIFTIWLFSLFDYQYIS